MNWLEAIRGFWHLRPREKRAIIARMGGKLTILDRIIHFAPDKYFVPIAKMNQQLAEQKDLVRTGSEQIKKEDFQPQITNWLPGLDSNQ